MASSSVVIAFDPEAHRYTLPDGRVVPSVTGILRETGISVDFEALSRSSRHAEAIALKRDIGSALHLDAWAYDDDDLDWSSVDPRVEPYLRAWAAFRANTGLQPMTRERRVYHPALHYCGTLDGIFLAPNGHKALVDLKTGDPEDAGAQYQTAAYKLAYEAEHGRSIDERWSVQLFADRPDRPYRIDTYTDWRDEETWRCIVRTYYCQHARRRSAA